MLAKLWMMSRFRDESNSLIPHREPIDKGEARGDGDHEELLTMHAGNQDRAKSMIGQCGVRKRGWMLPKKAGKSPRSPMAKVTRGVCRTLALRYPYAEMSVPAATMRTAQYGKKPRAESTTGAADRPALGIV